MYEEIYLIPLYIVCGFFICYIINRKNIERNEIERGEEGRQSFLSQAQEGVVEVDEELPIPEM